MNHVNKTELLNYVRQNAEAALNGIDMVEGSIKSSDLQTVIKQQKSEYHSLYAEADAMLRRENGTPENMPLMAKMSATVVGNLKKLTYKDDRDIANTMIEGTTMGITALTKHIHEYDGNDKETVGLCNRVIAFEENCIEELKPYL